MTINLTTEQANLLTNLLIKVSYTEEYENGNKERAKEIDAITLAIYAAERKEG